MIIQQHTTTTGGYVASVEVATNGTITKRAGAEIVNERDQRRFTVGRKWNVYAFPDFRVVFFCEVTLELRSAFGLREDLVKGRNWPICMRLTVAPRDRMSGPDAIDIWLGRIPFKWLNESDRDSDGRSDGGTGAGDLHCRMDIAFGCPQELKH